MGLLLSQRVTLSICAEKKIRLFKDGDINLAYTDVHISVSYVISDPSISRCG